MNLDEELIRAVSRHDVEAVRACLEAGADPNLDRSDAYDEPDAQPTTPLRLVVFAISDALLDDDGLRDFAAIARLLLRHGADPVPAMRLAELRYGTYDPAAPPGPFMDVWHLVARGRP